MKTHTVFGLGDCEVFALNVECLACPASVGFKDLGITCVTVVRPKDSEDCLDRAQIVQIRPCCSSRAIMDTCSHNFSRAQIMKRNGDLLGGLGTPSPLTGVTIVQPEAFGGL
jgi:hypothetical protein